MAFIYQQSLIDYMKKHNKSTIVVEMVEINNSDFEISEFHIRFVDKRMRDQFVDKNGYRVITTEHGEILLPRFPLDMDENVTFGLKKMLFFNHITCEGIKTPK